VFHIAKIYGLERKTEPVMIISFDTRLILKDSSQESLIGNLRRYEIPREQSLPGSTILARVETKKVGEVYDLNTDVGGLEPSSPN